MPFGVAKDVAAIVRKRALASPDVRLDALEMR